MNPNAPEGRTSTIPVRASSGNPETVTMPRKSARRPSLSIAKTPEAPRAHRPAARPEPRIMTIGGFVEPARLIYMAQDDVTPVMVLQLADRLLDQVHIEHALIRLTEAIELAIRGPALRNPASGLQLMSGRANANP